MTAPADYHDRLNTELLARLPAGARYVLEIGCGSGALARTYRAGHPAANYTGVECDAAAARRAQAACTRVVLGDIEAAACWQALDQLRPGPGWDLVVLGDVLEHLRDPLATLAGLAARASVEARCVACIPNVGHVSLVYQLLQARWDYADDGLLDRTHLRFFTQPTMVALFAQAGWEVQACTARVFEPEATERALLPLLELAPRLGMDTEAMRLHLSAYQWLVEARRR